MEERQHWQNFAIFGNKVEKQMNLLEFWNFSWTAGKEEANSSILKAKLSMMSQGLQKGKTSAQLSLAWYKKRQSKEEQ